MTVPMPSIDGLPIMFRAGMYTLQSGDEIPAEVEALVPDAWKQPSSVKAPKPTAEVNP